MTGYVKYGCIWLSVGCMITGTLWYTRDDLHIRGEDAAALLAGYTERNLLAYATGTNAPVWPTNLVSSIPQWSTYYGKILSGSRFIATNTPTSLPAVLWLDASLTAPTDGDTLTTYGNTWAVSSIATNAYAEEGRADRLRYNWSIQNPTNNAQDHIPSTASRMPAEGIMLFPRLAATNAPFVPLLYPYITASAAHLAGIWPNGNWWTRIGNGTSVYQYACEKIWDTEPITVTKLVGAGYTNGPTAFTFSAQNYATPQAESFGKSTVGNTIRASAYEITAPGRNREVFVVADQMAYQGNVYTFAWGGSTPKSAFSTGTGNTVSFGVCLNDYPWSGGGVGTVTLTAQGSGVSVTPSTLSFGSFYYVAKEAQVTVTTGNAGVIRLSYDGSVHYVAVIGAASTNSDFTVTPRFQEIPAASSSCSAAVSLKSAFTNVTVTTGRSITTNGLYQAKNVIEGLRRTVYLCPASALSYTGSVYYTGGASTYTNVNNVESSPGLSLDSGIGDAFGAIVETGIEEGHAWSGIMATFSATAARALIHLVDLTLGWSVYRSVDVSYSTSVLTGCTLPYPSAYACASGYVAKVSIYAIALSDPAVKINSSAGSIYGINLLTAEHVENYSGDATQPDAFNAIDLGLGYNISPTPSAPQTFVDTLSRFDSADAVATPSSYVLSLVHEETAPTVRPAFTLGTRALTYSSEYMHGFSFETSVHDSGDVETQHYTASRKAFDRSVRIGWFVVVVDWAWKHMNPDTPFSPEHHTPEWAVTNAP
jgi:hypothetical protein